MTGFLRDRYIWYIVAVLGISGIFVYTIEPYLMSRIPPELERQEAHLILVTIRSGLLLIVVGIAAWRFRVKGGLATVIIICLILLPHVLHEMLESIGPGMLGYYGFGAAVGIGASWLVGTRRRAEEDLRRTMAALARSNTELEQFAYVASHDLQEPLRMVSSFTQLLARRYQGKLDKDADEFIAYAVDGATRMQCMINDLLSYSRVGTRGKPFQPADCEAVLYQAVANLRLAIEESGAEVTHDPLPQVMGDESQLVQLFQNLLANAIKFHSQEPLQVHVSAERKGKEWVFSVSDNGIGIDPQYADRIFLVFQRLHSREEYPGSGIGLAICNKIVERHGGRIWVESEPGKGAIFYFTIPIRGGKQL